MNHAQATLTPDPQVIDQPAKTSRTGVTERCTSAKAISKKERPRTAGLLAPPAARIDVDLPTSVDKHCRQPKAPETTCPPCDNDEDAVLTLTISSAVKVRVQGRVNIDLDIRADFASIDWRSIRPITDGIKCMLGDQLKISRNEVEVIQSMLFEAGKGTARVLFKVPTRYKEALASKKIHRMFQDISRGVVLGVPTLPIHRPETVDMFEPLQRVVLAEDQKDNASMEFSAEAVPYTQAILRRMGGRTLACKLVIEAPGWRTDVSIGGTLAPKPIPDTEDNMIKNPCRVDGFARSKRIVHLVLRQGGALVDVAFDEARWFKQIVDFAGRDNAEFEASYKESISGSKTTRELVNLTELNI